MAAYDPVGDRMVMFGNITPDYGTIGNDETWFLDFTDPPTWTQLSTPIKPAGRATPVMVYDAARNRMLLFSGYSGTYLNDVWQLSLTGTPVWSQVTTANAPPLERHISAGIYDPIGDRMIIVGGYHGGPIYDDVWALNLSGAALPYWRQLLPSGDDLPPTYGHTAVYDAKEDRMIVMGGQLGDEIWGLRLRPTPMWSRLTTTGPSLTGQLYRSAVYDLGYNRILAFGGYGPASNDLWEVSLGPTTAIRELLNAQGSVPDPRYLHSAVLRQGGQMIVYGGRSSSSVPVYPQVHILTWTALPSLVPVITSAVPDSGSPGTTVQILGSNFTGAAVVVFGGGPPVSFSVIDDGLIEAVLDTSSSTGPIRVTTPGGTALSTFAFRVIKNPRPTLTSVRDVPADQGGRVLLHWLPSYYDRAGYTDILGYRIWRRSIFPTQNAARAVPGPLQITGGFWEAIGEMPARYLDGYAFAAQTLIDSTEMENPYVAFAVEAFTSRPFDFYFSNIDSGYSVDNLAPAAPLAFMASVFGSNNTLLRWKSNRESDLSRYNLHRGSSPDFVPSPSNRLTATSDTFYVDQSPGGGVRFYKVAGEDVHGNIGVFSLTSAEPPVATLASLVSTEVLPNWVRLEWQLSGDPAQVLTVYRRSREGDWNRLRDVHANSERRLIVEDEPSGPGEYGYQLRAESHLIGETWVDVPGLELAIESLAPNPTKGPLDLSVVFQGDAGRIDVFDVRGRRVATREVAPSSGRQRITFHETAALAPGVYALRLTSGNQWLTRRFLVVR